MTQIKHKTYTARAADCTHPLAKKLLTLLDAKQTNLALSADVTRAAELIDLADTLGPELCILKTHIDIIEDFTPKLTQRLRELADKHQFLIFEDRKFADIGHTVHLQYWHGIYRIAEWADIINAHSLPGPGIIQGLANNRHPGVRGVLLLAQMSSAGNLFSEIYQQTTLQLAEQHPETVFGFIAQQRFDTPNDWLYLTPGVQFSEKTDTLGQQYITPEQAILENGSDIIIVGRGILRASAPLNAAKKYREAGWQAYQKRMT